MEPSQEIFDAVRAGDTGRLQALLRSNPGLANARNERGHTPVLIAQYRDKPDAVALLLAAEPELDIFDAASVGRTERVAEWLDRDPGLLNAASSDGFSPLGLAAFFGHADTVKLLLARGADTKGAAALAATKGRLDVLKLLQEQGR
jgi:ankyrin repeat protein